MDVKDLASSGLQNCSVTAIVSGPESGDDATLARLGKKPVLQRRFSFITSLGFSCTVLITWEGSLLYAKHLLESVHVVPGLT